MANMSKVKVPMPEQDPKVRAHNFEEVTLGYTEEQAVEVQTAAWAARTPPVFRAALLTSGSPSSSRRSRSVTSVPLTISSSPPTPWVRSPAVSAPRKASAKASASVASRVSLLPSAVWSASSATGTTPTIPAPSRA